MNSYRRRTLVETLHQGFAPDRQGLLAAGRPVALSPPEVAELEHVRAQACPYPARLRFHDRSHGSLSYSLYIRAHGDQLASHSSTDKMNHKSATRSVVSFVVEKGGMVKSAA